MPAAIQHPVNDRHVSVFELVVNGVRKPFGQQPMEAKNLPVNPGIKNQRIYVRKKRI
jgi:hypothetical protein